MIKCEIELDLTWTKYCAISEISRTPEVPRDNPADATLTTGATFKKNNTKLYVPLVALSVNDNINFLKNIKQGFKRRISWNKYRSEITTHPKNNNLDYLIDPTFRNINTLFVLLFKNGDDDPTKNSFEEYYMPFIEIKNFNRLVENKPYFNQSVKNKEEV